MDIRTAKKHTLADFEAGNCVLWKSSPGMAKTACAFELLDTLKALHPGKRIGMCRAFMATETSVDAVGIPWKGSKTVGDRTFTITDSAMPKWYISSEGEPACCYDLVLMVFEEWGQGEAETKRAYANVLLEGGVPGFYLPPGSFRLALSNIDSADGVTKEFDFVIGRRKEYTISGSVQVWLEDFAENPYQWNGKEWMVSPLMKVWAKNNAEIFFEDKPKVQGPWCNPRTATATDRYMQITAKNNGGTLPIDDPALMEGMAGGIGMNATQSLLESAKFELQLPKYEQVVMDPMGTDVPKKADMLLLMSYKLAGRAQSDDLDPVIKYVERMPKDMAVTFASSLMKRDYTMRRVPAMQAWIGRNSRLVSMVASLSQ